MLPLGRGNEQGARQGRGLIDTNYYVKVRNKDTSKSTRKHSHCFVMT